MPNTEQLLYQTEKSSHRKISIKMLFVKIFQYSWESTCVKFLRTPLLKNICIWLPLIWIFEEIVWNFFSGWHFRVQNSFANKSNCSEQNSTPQAKFLGGFGKHFSEFAKGIYETCDHNFFNLAIIIAVFSIVQFVLFLCFANNN